jgi:hypothetical protein
VRLTPFGRFVVGYLILVAILLIGFAPAGWWLR